MKRKITFILVLSIIIAVSIYITTYIYSSKRLPFQIQHPTKFINISTLCDIAHTEWIDNNRILVTCQNQQQKIFNLQTVTTQDINQETNKILCILQNRLTLLTTRNFVITSPTQTATEIILQNFDIDNSDNNKEAHAIKLHQTVKPIFCSDDYIFLQDNYVGSPERLYVYNIKQNKISQENTSLEEILFRQWTLHKENDKTIPKDNIMRTLTNAAQNAIIIQTKEGIFYVYIPKNNTQ